MNILRRLDDAVKLQRGEMVRPEFVDLHTSNVCNMNCRGCAYRGQLSRDYMPEVQHFEAVNQFIDFGVRAFDFAGGGEPTCLPYLPRLMRHIADRGAHCALITNGLLMSDDLVGMLLEHATYCRISLEASNRESYAAYKRVDARAWDRVISNVKRLVQERDRRGSELEISLKFAVGKTLRGYQHYRDIAALIRGLGIDRATVKALRHEPEELDAAAKFDEHCMMQDICGADPAIHGWILPHSFDRVPQCYLNPMHTVMDWRGNLWLCCYGYVHGPGHIIGNIFDASLEQLWFSEEHKRRIAAIDRNKCRLVDCKFFHHHTAIEKALRRGAGFWL